MSHPCPNHIPPIQATHPINVRKNNHGKVMVMYDAYLDTRREMMQFWADWLDEKA